MRGFGLDTVRFGGGRAGKDAVWWHSVRGDLGLGELQVSLLFVSC